MARELVRLSMSTETGEHRPERGYRDVELVVHA